MQLLFVKKIHKIFWIKTKLTKIECQGHLAIKNFLIENNAPNFFTLVTFLINEMSKAVQKLLSF